MDNSRSYTYRRYLRGKNVLGVAALAVSVTGYFILRGALNLNGTAQLVVLGVLVVLLKAADAIWVDERRHNYRTWGRGAGAELKQGRSLERLGPGHELIHDIPTGHGNVDHVCVGPTGIFVIETKAHAGALSFTDRLLLNGAEPERDFLKQLWAEVFYVRDLLKQRLGRDYRIEGILEFPNARADGSIRGKKRGVWIGGAGFANYAIQRGRDSLTADEIQSIAAALRRTPEPPLT